MIKTMSKNQSNKKSIRKSKKPSQKRKKPRSIIKNRNKINMNSTKRIKKRITTATNSLKNLKRQWK